MPQNKCNKEANKVKTASKRITSPGRLAEYEAHSQSVEQFRQWLDQSILLKGENNQFHSRKFLFY